MVASEERRERTAPASVRGIRRLARIIQVVLLLTPLAVLGIQWVAIQSQGTQAVQGALDGSLWTDGPETVQPMSVSLSYGTLPGATEGGSFGQAVNQENYLEWVTWSQMSSAGYYPPFWLSVHAAVEKGEAQPNHVRCFFDGTWVFFYAVEGSPNPKQSNYVPSQMIVANMSPEWTMAVRSFCLYAPVAAMLGVILQLIAKRITVQALEADRATREFFANASHELKTPLTAIEGYVDGMAAGVIAPEDAQPVIEREVGRVKKLVNQILALSKADAGAQKAVREPVDLREVVTDALADVAPEADKRGLALDADLPMPLPLASDEALLYGIVSNLLSNAVRHGATEVRVTARREGEALRVTVANDGQPLSDDALAHLFDRFYTGPGGNTGIGLALALEHTRLVGGTLTAAQEDGRTVLTLEVPAKR